VNGVKEDMKTMREDIKEQVQEIKESNRSQKESLSDFLVEFGQRLREGGGSRLASSREPPRSPMEVDDSSSPSMPPTSRFNIQQTHESVTEMYNEWWGLGVYKNKPVRGGFESLERNYKSRWRKHFDGGQVKHISRVKIVLQALNTLAEMDGNTLETAMNELDAVYRGECNKYITKMEVYIKHKGWYQKKKRRGKTATPSTST
jgi:hypothetical protein